MKTLISISPLLATTILMLPVSASLVSPLAHESYSYDESGNVIALEIGDHLTHLKIGSGNQISSTNVHKDLVYDSVGRITDVGSSKFKYGFDDRVLAVSFSDQSDSTGFYYNASGRLVAKRGISDGLTVIAWDGFVPVLWGEKTYVTANGKEDILLDGLPTLAVAQGTTEVIINDFLGNSLAVGDVEIRRTAYGAGLKLGCFNGQIFDEDLNAYIYAYRNYRPDLARWTTPDPLGFPTSSNNYKFASSPSDTGDYLGLLDWSTLGNPVSKYRPESSAFTLNSVVFKQEWEVRHVKTDDNSSTVHVYHQSSGFSGWRKLVGSSWTIPSSSEWAAIQNVAKHWRHDWTHNCHGFNHGASHYWIEDSEMPMIISGDGWEKVVGTPSETKTVIAQYNSSWEHEALVTGRNAQGVPSEVLGKLGADKYPKYPITTADPDAPYFRSAPSGQGVGWVLVDYWEK